MAKSATQSQWERSETYRKEFIKHNPGIFGCIYFCAYCGRPMTRKTMQVDHHIAVKRAQKNPIYKAYLGSVNTLVNIGKFISSQITGKPAKYISGVNVTYNLVPACPKCNNRKSDSGGLWILRGMIGGTLWKLTNLMTISIGWLISQRFFQGVIVGLIVFAVIQYYLTGVGVIATILNVLANTLGALGAVVGMIIKL